jgi:hypothetical protein
MTVRLSALSAGRPLPPGRFLVLISVRAVDPRAIVRLEEWNQLKKSSDLIGNRTRDLPACSIAPQPTTLPLAPTFDRYKIKSPTTVFLIGYYFNTEFRQNSSISCGGERHVHYLLILCTFCYVLWPDLGETRSVKNFGHSNTSLFTVECI